MPSVLNVPPRCRRPRRSGSGFRPRLLVPAIAGLLLVGSDWPAAARAETLPRAILTAPAPPAARQGSTAPRAAAAAATDRSAVASDSAELPLAAPRSPNGEASSDRALQLSPEFQKLLTGLVRENLPDKIEETKDWGQTKNMTVGLKVRRDGLRITTRRKRKEVNHGSWEMYRLTLPEGDEDFKLRVEQMRKGEDGRLEFDFVAYARLKAFGRWSRWQRGVQLVSLSADADARVRLRAHCLVAVRLDPSRLPPDVVVEPEVTQADIRLLDFRLNRLSDVGGPLARPLGKALEKLVDDKLEDKRKQLPEKINRRIARHQDDLRFSLHDVLRSPWSAMAGLPEPDEAEQAGEEPSPGGGEE